MPTAANARLQIEASSILVANAALTDSGDQIMFTSPDVMWSKRVDAAGTNFGPTVRPNGVISGGVITTTGVNDEVQTSAMSVNLNGTVTAVGADSSITITRTPAGDTYQINSITVNNAGAVVAVTGTEGAAFVETRGAAGGPPYIPTDSIEIGQVRTTSDTAAPIAAGEIFQVVGQHLEKATFPLWTVDYANGQIDFVTALPTIHTGDVPKAVWAEYYTPSMVNLQDVNNVVPPEETFSVSSSQNYDRVVNAVSKALSQGSFDALLDDGTSDLVVSLKGQEVWFKFFPDRTKTPNIIWNAFLGIARSFPADDNISVAATMSAGAVSVDQAA
jgi:hypothetical protein